MATHDLSMTVGAAEDIDQYAIVTLVYGEHVNRLPKVEMCNSSEDIIFGVAMTKAAAGELLTVRFPFSGILPGYAYTEVHPGDGLTIGIGRPGSLSNNASANYARRVAYIVQTGPPSTNDAWCSVLFVRARFNV
jgi:hypothetical protein